jgi:ubiquinone/menaquinone biosynthesis C-methylase UbiE
MLKDLNFDSTKNPKKNFYSVKFLDPKRVIEEIEINPGMKVAHFGCGAGFFTFSVAQKIGNEGNVYALDILEQKVEVVNSQAKVTGFENVQARRVNLEEKNGSGLDKESLDWVLIVNMLYQNENKEAVVEEAKRVLKKGGKILIIDWMILDSSMGPEMNSRVSKDKIIEIAHKNDLVVAKEFQASNFHFGLVLIK